MEAGLLAFAAEIIVADDQDGASVENGHAFDVGSNIGPIVAGEQQLLAQFRKRSAFASHLFDRRSRVDL